MELIGLLRAAGGFVARDRGLVMEGCFLGVVLAALAAAAPSGLRADDGPAPPSTAASRDAAVDIMWRLDGSGRFPDIHPPSAWRRDKNILWQTSVEAGGYSSPIVAGGKVFVTAEMGALVCLDLATGRVLWHKDLFSQQSNDIPAELSKKLMRGCGGESKQSTPTPTSNGELVFYINAMGLAACYDLQGNQKWIRIIETAEDEEGFCASPIFHGDRIILSWGCLMAVSARDGKTLWKAADAKPTYATPVIARIGREAVIITPAGDIVRLSDGEILCSGLFASPYTTPLIEGNVVYIIDGKSLAMELPAKAAKGMRPKELWTARLDGVFMASPVYKDGLLYTLEKRCRLHIVDAKTGRVLTASRVRDDAGKTDQLLSGVKIEGLAPAHYAYASPAAAEKTVFFFDDAGHAAVLEQGRTYKPVRINTLDDGFTGTPFFYQDKIIIRGIRTVYCIGAKD
jgi:outer membrane protein assembly factor BamB